MKKQSELVRTITEIAVFAALAFVLDLMQSAYCKALFVNGGSIGIAMLPVLIVSYRRGFGPGLICGIVVSFLQLLGGWYAIADSWYKVLFQLCLDYILTYPAVALAGIFAKKFKESSDRKGQIKWLSIGTVVGGLAKFLCHYLAGVIFWSYSCPDGFFGGPYVYSLVYNGAYCLPNIIICLALLILVLYKQPKIFLVGKKGEANNEK